MAQFCTQLRFSADNLCRGERLALANDQKSRTLHEPSTPQVLNSPASQVAADW